MMCNLLWCSAIRADLEVTLYLLSEVSLLRRNVFQKLMILNRLLSGTFAMSLLNLAERDLIRPAPAAQHRSSLRWPVRHHVQPALDPIVGGTGSCACRPGWLCSRIRAEPALGERG